jgi:hypothetical protein
MAVRVPQFIDYAVEETLSRSVVYSKQFELHNSCDKGLMRG